MERFAEKVVLITGASSGIGRATAERLAQEGASLVLADVQEEGLEATAKQCRDIGARVETLRCDVSQASDAEAAVAAAVAHFGGLDVLVNIAGILTLEHTKDTSLETWERVLRVNLTGTFLMCQAALPQLLERGGNIVNTSSTAALAGMPYGAAYGASKGGVLAFTRTLAVEYARQGLRANAICPGSIKTPMTGRSGLPEDPDWKLIQRAMALDEARGPETVAAVIAMVASQDGAHINGESIRMDGGALS
ncbi:MAG: short-chain dehydrogenase [Deltaproteobacteria bacterium]|jgi:NAD(P)-dependent dehydrogenase (short-subunit alcohol dehydrogenase family)|nr:short-chain dehydrogenase [Deltaproteobacteria bacterium]